MKWAKWYSVSGMALALLVFYGCTKNTSSEARMPRNIYILTASGLRSSHLSSYLYQSSQTPAMDFLAYDGIRFLNAFTTSPESLSAHLSLLTGLYPFHRRLRGPIDELLFHRREPEIDVVNMAEWFRKGGYSTAIFAADPELRYPKLLSSWFSEASVGAQEPPWKPGYDPQTICRIAREWVLRHRSKPQFVLLNFGEPTLPFEPPRPFDRHYARHPYDGEIAGLDREVGIFINSLKRAHMFENSIVLFTAPFGETLGDSIRTGSVSEKIIRIPFFLAAPGILPRHQEYDAAVSLVDVFPTLLKLLEADHSLQFDGKELFQKGNDQQISRKLIFGESRILATFGLPASYFVQNKQSQFMSSTKTEENPLARELKKRLAAEGLIYSANVSDGSAQLSAALEQIRISAAEGSFNDALQQIDLLRVGHPQSDYLQWYRDQIISYSSASMLEEPDAANR